MLKILFFAGLMGTLYLTNPTIQDAAQEAKRRVEEEQSMMRAGWSSISKATGINWLSKQMGAGNYEFCRKNLFLASVFVVRNSKLLDSEKPLAIMFGAANQVWAWRVPVTSDGSSLVLNQLVNMSSMFPFNECSDFHKAGDLAIR